MGFKVVRSADELIRTGVLPALAAFTYADASLHGEAVALSSGWAAWVPSAWHAMNVFAPHTSGVA
eukprot:131904-Chlamydomonas_euryale.AAC.5